jgi:hypothetical protein
VSEKRPCDGLTASSSSIHRHTTFGSGPNAEEMRARMQACFDDRDLAIPTLKHLLEIPYDAH